MQKSRELTACSLRSAVATRAPLVPCTTARGKGKMIMYITRMAGTWSEHSTKQGEKKRRIMTELDGPYKLWEP